MHPPNDTDGAGASGVSKGCHLAHHGCFRLLQHLFYLDDLMELLLLGTSGSGFAVTKGIATRMSQRRWGLNRGILLES